MTPANRQASSIASLEYYYGKTRPLKCYHPPYDIGGSQPIRKKCHFWQLFEILEIETISAVKLGKLASPFLQVTHETLFPLSQIDLLSFPKERQIFQKLEHFLLPEKYIFPYKMSAFWKNILIFGFL